MNKFNFDPQAFLSERGLTQGGRTQQRMANECIRLMADFTPMRTGNLIASAVPTPTGIEQTAEYAQAVYTNPNDGDGALRGAYWFDRMLDAGGTVAVGIAAADECGATFR